MLENRTVAILVLGLWILVPPVTLAQQSSPDLPGLEDILTSSELRAYRQKTEYQDRMDIFRDVLNRLGKQIARQTKEKDYAGIDRSLLQIRSISRSGKLQAEQSHTVKDARSRKVKRLEIELRRLVESLDDLKLGVHFELRLVFEEVRDQLEDFRSQLLGLLFQSSNRGFGSAPSQLPVLAFSMSTSRTEPTQRRRRGSGIQGDQFTELEYGKVQDAQKLMDRVKVFIEIAEARLDEIDRRRAGREWAGDGEKTEEKGKKGKKGDKDEKEEKKDKKDKKDKENPLEFYTIAQMVHAYDRSIEGSMIFIDDRVKSRRADEKEIKKALTLLNKKVQDFIPRLDSIRLQAIEQEDEELFIEIRSAIKNSDSALKGSQLGLGAPVKN